MAEGNSIINLSNLAKPATVLIKKISNAVGVLYEPKRIIKRAEAESKAEKIKALSSIELDEIQQRGIERFVHQETRKQENIENITAKAIKILPPTAKTEQLDEDWVAHFFDNCEKVSDEQMQTLWSSLLAGEATLPGTYSKRTLDIVSSMDKNDANIFSKFCQFTWMHSEPVPLIFDTSHKIYTNEGINFTSMKHLDSIGLISFESANDYTIRMSGKHEVIKYFDHSTLLEFKNDKGNKVIVGQALFTQAGKELFKICGAQKNKEFYQYVIKQLSNKGAILSSEIHMIKE